jgi:hypothetical protein
MGYHKSEIPKGFVGQYSKIEEEFLEFKDAVIQGNKVMELVELSDLYLAIQQYLDNYHPSIGMNDIAIMAQATKEAFESGERK